MSADSIPAREGALEPRRADQVRVVYKLKTGSDEDAFARLRAIVLEQTVEIPEDAVSLDLERRVVGHPATLERLDKRLWRAVVDYPLLAPGRGDLPQLLNWLFGNVSLYEGVRVEEVEWPASLLESFSGPISGVAGLRQLCPAADGRPLTVASLKALGERPAVLAERAGALARAGFDLIKDDHGLADQESAPFRARVEVCLEAITKANAASGHATAYAPNLTGPVECLAERAAYLDGLGIEVALVAPWLVGLDAMRHLAEDCGLALIAHPALGGAFCQPDHGLSPALVYGDLMRLAGADAVIFPWQGGRFALGEPDCRAILERLAAPLGGLRPALPMIGGGLPIDREPPQLPIDVALLFGGFLYLEDDLEAAGRAVVERVHALSG